MWALFLVVDAQVGGLILDSIDPAVLRDTIRTVGTVVLWGSYMAVSRRVRATFVR